MKNFTGLDVTTWQQTINHLKGEYKTFYKIYADQDELIDSPMWFHKKGLSETASGYGRRLNSGRKIMFNNRLYRLYVTIFSNSGSVWFKCKGTKIYVN